LAVALVGPYTAVQHALSASYVARDELAASALAQEGMEYIRSVRDNNYLNTSPTRTWMTGLSTLSCYGLTPSGYCTIDPTLGDVNTTPAAIAAYGTLANVPVLYITSTGLYNQQTLGTPTRFKRSMQIKKISETEVQVTITVSWISVRQSYSVVVTDNLQDWL
ncbi:MAG TPA: hypothetical protein PK109_00650, partial [Candidatus Paceibacterota bacterium]|nr:hypothetical protein [Candidatus Paceibacterota bacterium]